MVKDKKKPFESENKDPSSEEKPVDDLEKITKDFADSANESPSSQPQPESYAPKPTEQTSVPAIQIPEGVKAVPLELTDDELNILREEVKQEQEKKIEELQHAKVPQISPEKTIEYSPKIASELKEAFSNAEWKQFKYNNEEVEIATVGHDIFAKYKGMVFKANHSAKKFDSLDGDLEFEFDHLTSQDITKKLYEIYGKPTCPTCYHAFEERAKECPECGGVVEDIFGEETPEDKTKSQGELLKSIAQKDLDERIKNIKSATASPKSRRIKLEHDGKTMGYVNIGNYLGQDYIEIEDRYVTRNKDSKIWEDAITFEPLQNQDLLDIANQAEKTLEEQLAKEKEEAEEPEEKQKAEDPKIVAKEYLYTKVEYVPGLFKKYHIIRGENINAIRVRACDNNSGKYFCKVDGRTYQFDIVYAGEQIRAALPKPEQIAPNVLEQIVRNSKDLKPSAPHPNLAQVEEPKSL